MQIPITGRMSKQLRCIHTMEYCSTIGRNKLLTEARTWMNSRDVTEQKKADRRVHTLWFHLCAHHKVMVIESRTVGACWGRDWLGRGMRALSAVMEMFYILVGMWIIWVYAFVKTGQTEYVTSIPFIVFKLTSI